MTTRYERLKMQRRMQRRIRMVVEERRMAVAARRPEPGFDPEATIEIPREIQREIQRRIIGRAVVDSA